MGGAAGPVGPGRVSVLSATRTLAQRLQYLLRVYMALLVIIVAMVSVVFDYTVNRGQVMDQFRATTGLIAASSVSALALNDQTLAEDTLANLRETPRILQACLYNRAPAGEPVLFARYQRDVPCPPPPTAIDAEQEQFEEGPTFVASVPVTIGGEAIGRLVLMRDKRDILARMLLQLGTMLLCLLAALSLGVSGARRIEREIVEPLSDLAWLVRSATHSADYSARLEITGRHDEISSLAEDFNAMLDEIQRRQLAMDATTKRLEAEIIERARAIEQQRVAHLAAKEALDEVRQAQDQLIEAEKMASLGMLVAGVAHEVNNPLGVCITAVSQLGEDVADLRAQADRLPAEQRAQAHASLDGIARLAALTQEQLGRAADLVASFKRVAVDRTDDVAQEIDLQAYVEQILRSLEPQLKRRAITLQAQIPPGLMLHTYPGTVAQVLTNIVLNALTHAFPDPDAQGHITISGEATAVGTRLRIADDGVGMSEEVRRQVFEPFFTTRRGQGGSGLGMHLVYNLINQHLLGTIRVHSRLGQGTVFEITLPRFIRRAGSATVPVG
ncbi:MAG: ATP-binding protein [Oceanococcaceae bacterium]